ncbi:MAG: GGDEF domain-containing protein [Gammaproteobacteria bacterium]
MAAIADVHSLDTGAVRKVLRMLDVLRQSPAGGVVYRQIERMLDDVLISNQQVQQAYANLASALLDTYALHLHAASPLQVQVKLLRMRLQPPLTAADLQALRQYVDGYSDQITALQAFDQGLFTQAIRPLLQAYGIDDPPARSARAPARRHPLESLGGQPTLKRESIAASSDIQAAPESVASEHADQQQASRRQEFQAMQADLAQQILDTITHNQEFGILLEVVLNELRQVGDATELENLRWTLIREVEKLMSGHHGLADKLDTAHHCLQVVESDSRQLSDELTRVRLLSLTDELTGLPNRRAFLQRLDDEVARVQRYGFPLSLALMDLDKFKEINDRYGHAGGDEVLRVYSKSLLSIFRHHDLVARYGGEEFAVLLPNTEGEGALRALNKVRHRCAETHWETNGTTIQAPSFSAGLAVYRSGESSAVFVDRADKALYRAKHLGRDRIEIDIGDPDEGEETPGFQQGTEAD